MLGTNCNRSDCLTTLTHCLLTAVICMRVRSGSREMTIYLRGSRVYLILGVAPALRAGVFLVCISTRRPEILVNSILVVPRDRSLPSTAISGLLSLLAGE